MQILTGVQLMNEVSVAGRDFGVTIIRIWASPAGEIIGRYGTLLRRTDGEVLGRAVRKDKPAVRVAGLS